MPDSVYLAIRCHCDGFDEFEENIGVFWTKDEAVARCMEDRPSLEDGEYISYEVEEWAVGDSQSRNLWNLGI